MGYQNTRPKPTTNSPDPLERGRFTDGRHRFAVYASSVDAPDSFQVCADGNRADLVLIVSGLNTQNLHATWGDEWRSRSAEWRDWTRSTSFNVFYNGSQPDPGQTRHYPDPDRTRYCNG